MSLIQLDRIPFRKVVIAGNVKYVSDLGDVRLIVDYLSMLNGGPISIVNPMTGYKVNYDFSMKLPGLVTVTELSPGVLSLVPDTNRVMLICQQRVWSNGNAGSIVSVSKNIKVDEQLTWKYNFSQRFDVNRVNYLQGVIVSDYFTTLIPTYFKDQVSSLVIDDKGIESISNLDLKYGNFPEITAFDSFIAENEVEMLNLSVKLGDRCYRVDTQSSYINITGFNGSINDWKDFLTSSGEPVDLTALRTEFDLKLKEQETFLTGISVALGG